MEYAIGVVIGIVVGVIGALIFKCFEKNDPVGDLWIDIYPGEKPSLYLNLFEDVDAFKNKEYISLRTNVIDRSSRK